MKVLKILGVIVAVIAIAGVVFYMGWMRAPSAEDVCGNLAMLAKKESGVELPAKERDACIRSAQAPEFGRIPWVKQMKCMRDAKSLTEVGQCGG